MRYADFAYKHSKIREHDSGRGERLDKKAREQGFANTADYIHDVQGRKDTRSFEAENNRTCWVNEKEKLWGWNNKEYPEASTVMDTRKPDKEFKGEKEKETKKEKNLGKEIKERDGLSEQERRVSPEQIKEIEARQKAKAQQQENQKAQQQQQAAKTIETGKAKSHEQEQARLRIAALEKKAKDLAEQARQHDAMQRTLEAKQKQYLDSKASMEQRAQRREYVSKSQMQQVEKNRQLYEQAPERASIAKMPDEVKDKQALKGAFQGIETEIASVGKTPGLYNQEMLQVRRYEALERAEEQARVLQEEQLEAARARQAYAQELAAQAQKNQALSQCIQERSLSQQFNAHAQPEHQMSGLGMGR